MKNIAELLVSYINLQYLYDIITVAKIKKNTFLIIFCYTSLPSSSGPNRVPQENISVRICTSRYVHADRDDFFSQNMCLHARTFHTV